jgi:hypothetical protein
LDLVRLSGEDFISYLEKLVKHNRTYTSRNGHSHGPYTLVAQIAVPPK